MCIRDSIKAAGVDAFRELIENARDFVAFYIDMNGDRLGTIEGRSEVANELFSILQDVDDELRRDEYLKRVARGLHVDEWALRREFQKSTRDRGARFVTVQKETPPAPISPDDRAFVAMLLGHEPMLERVKAELEGIGLGRGPLAEVLQGLFQEPGPDLLQRLQSDGARSLYTAAANELQPWDDKAEALVQKRVVRLTREALIGESDGAPEAIRQAERLGDMKRVIELLSHKSSLDKEIEKLGGA